MDLSLSKSGQNARTPLQSVFETDYDNTELRSESGGQERWRFRGPWLAGKTHGEFTEYVDKKISNRRSEFREFLRDVRARALKAARRRELIESGEGPEALRESSKYETVPSDQELDVFIKQLRQDITRLNRLVEDFLDLPREHQAQRASTAHESVENRGPPSTHPSAGLSYLRSHSHTVNHPLYGPQENKPPVKARVLHPQVDTSGYRRVAAVLGVGGVTTLDSKRTFDKQSEKEGVKSFDPDIEGGGKLYVQLRKASISPEGRIELGTQRADRNALHALGVDERPALPSAAIAAAQDRSMPASAPRTRNTQGYGLESLGDMRRSERALPFTEGTDLQEVMRKALQANKPHNKPNQP